MRTGEVVTFYSYKGGTGRTMALANVAALLDRVGHRVLMMDWDLEAPGLHRFFAPASSPAGRGVIDLLEALARRVVGKTDLDESQTDQLIRELTFSSYVQLVPETSLELICAGNPEHSTYAQRVSAVPWEAMHTAAPFLFQSLATVLAERYDYVLVDSRTGLSDTSGVCTALLPEKLVVVFTPNQQSVDGAVHRARAAVTYRRRSDDLRPLIVYPLASRVELSEEELRHRWRHGTPADANSGYQPAFEQLFGDIYALPECSLQTWFDEVQIQHSTRYAFGEEIAVLEQEAGSDRLSLARSYTGFTRALSGRDTAPWTITRPADSPIERAVDREDAVRRIRAEIGWNETHANFARRWLLLARLLQLLIGLTAAIVIAVADEYQSWTSLTIAATVLSVLTLVFGIEVFATISGVTRWRRFDELANRLSAELLRFETRARPYSEAEDAVALLGDRVSDSIDEINDRWSHPSAGLFNNLAPSGSRRRSP